MSVILDSTYKSQRNMWHFFYFILAHKICSSKHVWKKYIYLKQSFSSKWLFYCLSTWDVQNPWDENSLTNHQNCKSIIRLGASYRKQRICSSWLTGVMKLIIRISPFVRLKTTMVCTLRRYLRYLFQLCIPTWEVLYDLCVCSPYHWTNQRDCDVCFLNW